MSAMLIGASACGDRDSTTRSTETSKITPEQHIAIEGWQGENDLWNDQILETYRSSHPNVDVEYVSTPAVEFNETIDGKISASTAGDVIACHPFDWSLDRFERGLFSDLTDLDGMERFSEQALSAFGTDDGFTQFCVPAIANTTGFLYNKSIFAELGLTVPRTTDEFFTLLDTVRDDGRYLPLALGTSDAAWVTSALGYESIGPAYWDGEVGRLRLISGAAHLTDPEFSAPFEVLARWRNYLPTPPQPTEREAVQHMFLEGKAAIAPAGSWEIGTGLTYDIDFGMFPPPARDESTACVVLEHPDLGFALNTKSENQDAARTFLEWTTTAEFASVYTNAYPGLFSLQPYAPPIDQPISAEVSDWMKSCQTTRRLSGQILSRGDANFETELANTSKGVLDGTLTPADAAQHLEDIIDRG